MFVSVRTSAEDNEEEENGYSSGTVRVGGQRSGLREERAKDNEVFTRKGVVNVRSEG